MTVATAAAKTAVLSPAFDEAIAWVLLDEGGYAERAMEGGGAVNMGITFTLFVAWRLAHGKPHPTFADLRAILLILRDRQYGECLKAQIGLATQMATALERSSVTNAAVAASLDSRTGVFERLNERVGALSSDVESNAKSVMDRITTNGGALEDIRGTLGEMRLEGRAK